MSFFHMLAGSIGGGAFGTTGTITDGTSNGFYGWNDGSVTTVLGGSAVGSITGQTSPDGNECVAMAFGVFGAGPSQTSTSGYIYFSGDFSSGPAAFTNISIDSTGPGGKSLLSSSTASVSYDSPSDSTRYAWVETVPSSPTPTNSQYQIWLNMTQTTTQDYEWNV